MSESEKPKLTEPDTVTVLWCDEVEVELRDGTARFTGLVDLTTASYDGPELRIVARLVMLPDTARAILRDLRKLQRGGH